MAWLPQNKFVLLLFNLRSVKNDPPKITWHDMTHNLKMPAKRETMENVHTLFLSSFFFLLLCCGKSKRGKKYCCMCIKIWPFNFTLYVEYICSMHEHFTKTDDVWAVRIMSCWRGIYVSKSCHGKSGLNMATNEKLLNRNGNIKTNWVSF